MANEIDRETLDFSMRGDIIDNYISKRRLTVKNYNYRSTIKDELYFDEATVLCSSLNMHPAEYVKLCYERMGENVELFRPKHLRGEALDVFFKKREGDPDSYKIEVTNATLPCEDFWRYHMEVAMRQMKLGRTMEEVLLDSSIKFDAWFRILVSPKPIQSVIDKYRQAAKKELNNSLIEFAKKHKLALGRIDRKYE